MKTRKLQAKLSKIWPWHVLSIITLLIFILVSLWLLLAYGELPRLWSKHEHKKIGQRQETVAYTSQDIPADPINMHITASAKSINCAFRRAGWSVADPLSVGSGVKIVRSVVLKRAYPEAPVSSLYFDDRLQDVAYERDEGKTAKKRHHVRLWQVTPHEWLGAATFDRGVGIALFTLQVTHHIGPKVDDERDAVGTVLEQGGAHYLGNQSAHIQPDHWHRNGAGDRYVTDGQIKAFALTSGTC